jgi:hypothetical protein
MEKVETEIVWPNTGAGQTKYTPKTIGKLITAFHSDYTVESACRYAEVAKSVYYSWIKEKPGFADKMTDAQNHLLEKAGEVVAATIGEGDAATARWFLDKRDPRYKAKVQVEVSEAEKELEDIAKDLLSDRTLIPAVRDDSGTPVGDDSTES